MYFTAKNTKINGKKILLKKNYCNNFVIVIYNCYVLLQQNRGYIYFIIKLWLLKNIY